MHHTGTYNLILDFSKLIHGVLSWIFDHLSTQLIVYFAHRPNDLDHIKLFLKSETAYDLGSIQGKTILKVTLSYLNELRRCKCQVKLFAEIP